MTLVEQWRGHVQEDSGGDTFLARFQTPEGDVEALVYRHAVRAEDRGDLRTGTYLVWDFHDDPRADLYIPDYGKRVVTAEDIAAAREEARRWKALFAEQERWNDIAPLPMPDLRDLRPLSRETAQRLGFPFDTLGDAAEERQP